MQYNITFNPSKTVCQCFARRSYNLSRPRVMFCGKSVVWKDDVSYLGYTISCWDRDTSELQRRRREVYMRANLIATKFRCCSELVKKYLFNTYFGNIYCMSLWCPVKRALLDKVKVAYNDAFRNLFSYSRKSSASAMFSQNRVDNFTARRRKAAFSLLTRVASSSNVLISAVYNSRAFSCSSITKSWQLLLLGSEDATPFIT